MLPFNVEQPATQNHPMKPQRPFLRSLLALLLLGVSATTARAQLIISEFRLRGPNGANDEFVEIYNNSGADHTVVGGGSGYALAASDGVARFVIPNGTVIPAYGHYLGANSVAYSLSGYATADATYTTDIPDNAGLALFNTSVTVDFTLANRLDAVGSTSEANTLYKEGTGYNALTPFSIDYSFCRRSTNNTVNDRTIALGDGAIVDTNNNTSDFTFVDTNGTSAGAGQRLGSPGPENLSSPISTWPAAANIGRAFVDTGAALDASPNRIRDLTSNPAQNSTFGTLELNRTFTNNTGSPITRLRFRVLKILTFPAASGFADLRPRTSTDAVVAISPGGGGGTKTVLGTTLEQPPSQPNGGGFNSTFSVPSVTLGTPLAAGASVDVRFLFGIQQTGNYCIVLQPEALPGASDFWAVTGDTRTDTAADPTMFEGYTPLSTDLSITKTDGVATATPGGSVTYTITASNAGPNPVTGATVADTFPAILTGVTWTGVGAGGGTCTAAGSGNINDTVDLPVGASVTYTVSCAISSSATGTLANTATVSAPAGVTDSDPANNSATDTDTLAPQADLAITKTDGVTTATPGGSVTYTITASNAGPSDATGVTVADTFPASLTATWTGVGAGGGTCTAAGSGNINDTVNLPVGASVTYTVSCTISSSATGTLANTATVAAPAGVTDPTPANNSATDTDTLAPQADLSITKTNGVTQVNAGGAVTYTITASNAGPSDATGVTVADTFPASMTGVTWTGVGAGGGTGTAAGAGNISDTVNLPSGGSFTYTVTGTLSPAAFGTLANTATITAPGGVTDPTPGNDSATDTDAIKPKLSADLNNDGKDDLLFENVLGQLTAWYLDGSGGVTSAAFFFNGFIGDYRLVGKGDLNSDGKTDLVFQDPAGRIAIWYLDGSGGTLSAVYLNGTPTAEWRVVGVGDLNNDGKADILFQNPIGQLAVWYMDGAGGVTSAAGFYPGFLYDARVKGIADINSDGKPDLVFQNAAGQIIVWYLDGSGATTSAAYLTTAPLGDTRIACLADVNGDGKADIVFQNGFGYVSVWYLDGAGGVTSVAYITTSFVGDWRVR